MAEGEITTFSALTERFNLPPGNYKKPKLLYCSNGGHFLRILPDGTVDGTRDRSDQHIQLQLSAESAGEVYIKGTETGQYLAMDTDGLLYGSEEMCAALGRHVYSPLDSASGSFQSECWRSSVDATFWTVIACQKLCTSMSTAPSKKGSPRTKRKALLTVSLQRPLLTNFTTLVEEKHLQSPAPVLQSNERVGIGSR
ncbi:fibroblast growth factor 1 [Cricetulus griseus]